MKKLTLGFLALSLMLLGGCIKKFDTSSPIMKVNGRVITENMFQKVFKQSTNAMLQGRELDAKNPQNKFLLLINKNSTVNTLILMELIKYEADQRKLKITNKDIDTAVKDIITKIGGQEKFESILALSKLDEDTFRDNVKLDLLKQKLVENIVGNNGASDEEVKKFYEENKEAHFKHGEQVRAAHILISASEADLKDAVKNENATANLSEDDLNKKVQEKLKEKQAKAQDILQQAKKDPAKFEELAKKYSEDTSTASKGGDLGFFPKEEMVPDFSKVAFATKPGQISDVVKTEFGYHIIKVIDRKEAGATPLDEVAVHIKKYLESKKKMDALRTLIETSRQSASIVYLNESYNPDRIQKELKALQEMNKNSAPAQQSTKPVAEKPKEQDKTE
ncbi:MAG: hypothetical protein A2Y25_06015 [Candidatus Melainabacteria bacterium GWF2_37_15]|nr:MAG: hypothetical protein A2Y25_06015 [Candidatus Melainabacteria bacterium GWF2_37_15]